MNTFQKMTITQPISHEFQLSTIQGILSDLSRRYPPPLPFTNLFCSPSLRADESSSEKKRVWVSWIRLRLRVLAGKIYNLAGVPGIVRDCDYAATAHDTYQPR